MYFVIWLFRSILIAIFFTNRQLLRRFNYFESISKGEHFYPGSRTDGGLEGLSPPKQNDQTKEIIEKEHIS